MSNDVSPPNRAYAGDQAQPVRGENEDENAREKPERPLDEMRTDDAFEKCVQPFHQPFPKILDTTGHQVHVSGSDLSKKDEAHGNYPAGDHGIGDWEAKRLGDLYGFWRRTLSLQMRRGRSRCSLSGVHGQGLMRG
ncbi:hypothetical protein RBB80_12130 [Tunturiibacter gelidiferens]